MTWMELDHALGAPALTASEHGLSLFQPDGPTPRSVGLGADLSGGINTASDHGLLDGVLREGDHWYELHGDVLLSRTVDSVRRQRLGAATRYPPATAPGDHHPTATDHTTKYGFRRRPRRSCNRGCSG